ncbi:MAG: ShlB/FhaC/HecB family hemolysin secretion/activation protein, partial [Limnobacter sp.]|nr:ShlB/FhaC/HecB family hemolysin secretion/activation protein [Limnobacter sp.]
FWGSARGQWARDNLDSTEQCSLGGATALRGYEQGTASGDLCQLYTAEFRYLTRLPGFTGGDYAVSLAAFYDLGRVQYRFDASRQLPTFTQMDKLASSGISLNWDFNSDGLFQLVWAQDHGEVTDNPDPQQVRRLSASLTVRF